MTRCLAVAVALVGIAVGCSGERPSDERPHKKVFEMAIYAIDGDPYLGFGSSIRQVDPETLKPATRRGLRLGGYSWRLALSPDREEAVFGIDSGELVFVDLPKMELKARLRLGSTDLIVQPIGWPRRDLLYVLSCRDAGKYGCFDNRLLLIDPTGPKQVAAIDLNGGASGRYDWTSRRAVIRVSPINLKPTRLLVGEPSGSIHEVELGRILAGTEERRFGPHIVSPGFVVGGGRAIVLGTRGLIAEVSLKSRRVRYHRLAGLAVSRRTLQRARAEPWVGTMNPFSDENVGTIRAWPGILLVASSKSELGRQGESVRRATVARFLDTSTWLTRPAPRPYGQPAADVLLVGTSSVDEQAKRYRGPFALLAYERSGTVRYRLDFGAPFTHSTYGDRLYVGKINGRKTRIYDARTGKLLRRIRATEVEPAFTWTPPG